MGSRVSAVVLACFDLCVVGCVSVVISEDLLVLTPSLLYHNHPITVTPASHWTVCLHRFSQRESLNQPECHTFVTRHPSSIPGILTHEDDYESQGGTF